MITPGLIDLQINGFAGIDFNSGDLTADQLDHALQALLATGVTSCLPTIITASPQKLEQRFLALDKSVQESRLGRLMCPGYHLEGPFLNPDSGYSGCHPADAMTAANLDLFEHLQSLIQRPILLTTLAPEVKGGIDFIRHIRARNVLVAIGHSACDFDMAVKAAEAGATLSTHLGNGLPQILPKFNNTIFAQLAEERLAASFIADGIHIPSQVLKVLLRAKGKHNTILVTDAVSAAMAPAGSYRFADMHIERRDDSTVLNPNGEGLAGSSLRMDDAIRNLVHWGLATFEEAVAMASSRVATLLAPVLSPRGITLPPSQITWSDSMTVTGSSINNEEYYAT
ncbi:N-acetylglucosamine-6-phosphate deacetylase [Brucella sp. BE17]|uniref:N-acetylglucosamine-6-phosphate deacetylase n=1 Tax=Brucella sp. BE17 TaxID=3142977 RepID=UPI0031BB2F98